MYSVPCNWLLSLTFSYINRSRLNKFLIALRCSWSLILLSLQAFAAAGKPDGGCNTKSMSAKDSMIKYVKKFRKIYQNSFQYLESFLKLGYNILYSFLTVRTKGSGIILLIRGRLLWSLTSNYSRSNGSSCGYWRLRHWSIRAGNTDADVLTCCRCRDLEYIFNENLDRKILRQKWKDELTGWWDCNPPDCGTALCGVGTFCCACCWGPAEVCWDCWRFSCCACDACCCCRCCICIWICWGVGWPGCCICCEGIGESAGDCIFTLTLYVCGLAIPTTKY